MDDLKLQAISKHFGDLEVIKNLSLNVRKGELCCLLGPSGCGKTTTLKMIAGFLEPDTGTIHLDNQDITRISPQRRNVGMVFQNYALFPHMNVFDNVAYGLRRRRWPKTTITTEVAEILNLVQLSGYEKRRIHELSGGQQQRIALARSLIIRPKLLLLDEPLSNLDARLRSDMRDEIRRIQRTLNMTTVYVTHDQEEAMSIADRIVVMNHGFIEQIGFPQEIYEKPATQFVADFIGRVNLLRGRIAQGKFLLLGKYFPISRGTWTDDAEVICAIRPERIQIGKMDALSFRATVQEVIYFGAIVRYRVAVENGSNERITLNIEVPSPQAVYKPGEQVGLNVRSDDIHVFPMPF
jgi:ABC-type Fe3+/spermidine/putrescine transport system ATPase subunit